MGGEQESNLVPRLWSGTFHLCSPAPHSQPGRHSAPALPMGCSYTREVGQKHSTKEKNTFPTGFPLFLPEGRICLLDEPDTKQSLQNMKHCLRRKRSKKFCIMEIELSTCAAQN